MKTGSVQTAVTLEDKLFKNSIYLGFFAIVLLLIYDVFFTGDYLSIIAEIFSIVFFLVNYKILEKHKSSNRHRFIFSMFLLLIVDYAWITGGGISVLLCTQLFLGMEFILVVNNAKYYKPIVIVLIANYLVLFVLEYFYEFNLSPDYAYGKGDLLRQFSVWFLLFFFGGFFTIFLKASYNKERENLSSANKSLEEKSREITDQNEELISSKEALDKTIGKLDSQKEELIVIKNTLEEKVRERTNDLLKVNERLLAQNQQLEQYAYITSHNLRAPIAQIKGLVHLLPLDQEFGPQTKETLRRLEGSTESIEKVFADLSMILNVKNSMQKPWDEVDFIHEINEVILSLAPTIKEKKITIHRPKIDAFPVKALRPYIYSIFHNIIENAVKYSDSTEEEPFVKIDLADTNKHYMLSISDNGIGIDMEFATGKVFQMYQRFNNTHPGQGFGLFLVKSQMEAMGGKVEVESILGVGTTFNLYFPKGT